MFVSGPGGSKGKSARVRRVSVGWPCIVVDPPWKFKDGLPGKGRGARKHYPLLTLEQLKWHEYRELVTAPTNAVLFLWRVSAMQPEAIELAESWGYTVKSEIVWEKTTRTIEHGRIATLEKLLAAARTKSECGALARAIELMSVPQTRHFGMGRIVRASHETCLICVRGKARVLNHSTRSRFPAPVGRHSEKPDRFFEIVEELVPGPRLELFARRERPGWHCLGNELSGPLIDQPAKVRHAREVP